jgi:hypothetical protein
LSERPDTWVTVCPGRTRVKMAVDPVTSELLSVAKQGKIQGNLHRIVEFSPR